MAKDNPAMSFVMLTESQIRPPKQTPHLDQGNEKLQSPISSRKLEDQQQPLSQQMELHTRLFEILSSRSDIDHPICNECTDLLLSGLQTRLSASAKERDAYITFLKELKNNVPTSSEVAEAESALAKAKATEEKAFAELLKLEKQKDSLEEEIAELDEESRALDLEEEEFWRSRNAFDMKLTSFRDTRDALKASYDHDAEQLERLQRTNIYNDTFCIGHDGYFGTINGLRLGRLPAPNNVEWAEINAAWGTTALLLATVAEKLRFSFRGYAIKPMGSTSRIDKIDYSQPASTTSSTVSTNPTPSAPARQQPKVTSLELYSSGDVPVMQKLMHRRFNDAMIAFLDCVKQLGDFVEKSDPRTKQGEGLGLPYAIDKDKINGVTIRFGVVSDESWTSACKYTITCCKFLLAHASNVATGGKG